ncbi:DUF4163 domain-containing protein [Leptolyngbya sp. 15MV]|nr:DUF4163 domain-containing protein [Leptolyngbya sp. 15MV]
MPIRLPFVAACLAPYLALAACSSADEMAEDIGVEQGATAAATATATAGGARRTVEENDRYTFSYAWPQAVGAIPALAAMLDARAAGVRAELVSTTEAEQAEFAREDIPYRAHGYGMEWKVVADTPRFLSLSGDFNTYTGGAHGMYGLESLVWDREAGAAFDGKAMFASPAALDTALGPRLCAALNAERARRRGELVAAGSDDTFDRCVGTGEATVLVGSADGRAFDRIGVWFGPYVAGPYAEGAFELDFPVDAAILRAVKPEYRGAFSSAR